MLSLLIIGSGQYGQLIKDLAITLGYEKIDFLDDNDEQAIGKISELESIQDNYTQAICSIGNPDLRENFSKRIINNAILINPKSYIANNAKIGKGCVIEANTTINTNTVIEDGCFICAGSVINHDSKVGKYSQVDCNSVVKGIVPEHTKIKACSLWEGNK